MNRISESHGSSRTRVVLTALVAAGALLALPAPAMGQSSEELHVITLMPVVFDVATGKVHECDVEESLDAEGLLVCAKFRPAVFTHTHGVGLGDVTGPSTQSHPDGEDGWSEDELQSDGSRYKTCGYWHAERHGLYPACDNQWPSQKQIIYVVMYRCLQSECTSDHWSSGIIHSDVLQPTTFDWSKTFENGVEKTGCEETEGSASYVSYHQASMRQDDSPFCSTSTPHGLMGGGVRYWP